MAERDAVSRSKTFEAPNSTSAHLGISFLSKASYSMQAPAKGLRKATCRQPEGWMESDKRLTIISYNANCRKTKENRDNAPSSEVARISAHRCIAEESQLYV